MSEQPIIQVCDISKRFKKQGGHDLLVLDKVNFDVQPGEVVALLGKSGSGKSTLLRTIAGLIQSTSGEVFYAGNKVQGPTPGLTMVFQHFALLPWLTVLENVELGLEAQGVPKAERQKRAIEAIDVVGLDGFESAYPKELSGGMCQRVGFARAMVVNPEVLLMDEPFSALDVLTAENLRSDLLDIWQSDQNNIKAVIIVTHNIEEAVMLANRILIFASDPGYIKAEIKNDLAYPRDDQSPEFRKLVDDIYTHMTARERRSAIHGAPEDRITTGYRLPKVEIAELVGLINTLAEDFENKADLPMLAEELHLDVDDLFPITEACEILHFANVSQGDINLTDTGKLLAASDMQNTKQLFSAALIEHVPLVKHITDLLNQAPNHRLSESKVLHELGHYLSEGAAEEVLSVAIDWGRYAELFAYDYDSGLLSLEDPE